MRESEIINFIAELGTFRSIIRLQNYSRSLLWFCLCVWFRSQYHSRAFSFTLNLFQQILLAFTFDCVIRTQMHEQAANITEIISMRWRKVASNYLHGARTAIFPHWNIMKRKQWNTNTHTHKFKTASKVSWVYLIITLKQTHQRKYTNAKIVRTLKMSNQTANNVSPQLKRNWTKKLHYKKYVEKV